MFDQDRIDSFKLEVIALREKVKALKTNTMWERVQKFENEQTLYLIEKCLEISDLKQVDVALKELLKNRSEQIHDSYLSYFQQPTNLVNQFCYDIAKVIEPGNPDSLIVPEFTPPSYAVMSRSNEKVKFDRYEEYLEEAKSERLVTFPTSNPILPKKMLHYIHGFKPDAQKQMLKGSSYQTALSYALLEDPSALEAFHLTEEQKKEILSEKREDIGDSALNVAAKNGKIDSLKLLLGWEPTIPQQQMALNLAIQSGQLDAAQCILRHQEVMLDARTIVDPSSPLELTKKDQKPVLVFKGNPSLTDRSGRDSQRNDLEREIYSGRNPAVLQDKLRQAAILPQTQQAECISRINCNYKYLRNPPSEKPSFDYIDDYGDAHRYANPSGGYYPYPNVLFYAADMNKQLFVPLVEEVLKQEPGLRTPILNTADHDGYTPLLLALRLNAKDVIPKLLNEPSLNVNARDHKGRTALHWAIMTKNKEATESLLQKGANVNDVTYDGYSPLHIAIKLGNEKMVDFLLKNNANINQWTAGAGSNLLSVACMEEQVEIVKRMLKDPRLTNLNISTALLYSNPEIAKAILEHVSTLDEAAQKECLSRLPDGPFDDVKDYILLKQPHLYHELCLSKPSTNPADVVDVVMDSKSEIKLNKHLHELSLHCNVMKHRSGEKYKTAADAMTTLINACAKAEIEFFKGEGNIDDRKQKFTKACEDAIAKARPVLHEHRGISWFSSKTKSEQLLDNLKKDIDDIAKPAVDGSIPLHPLGPS